MSKRSANNLFEEPAFKKQVTNETFEEMKTKNIELKNQNEKLRQDQIEGQKMCQEQIEKFQERTAVAEDKLHEATKYNNNINKYTKKIEKYTILERGFGFGSSMPIPISTFIKTKKIKYNKELLENKAQLNKLLNSDSQSVCK